MSNKPTKTSEPQAPPPYEAPVLKEFGTLLELTQSGAANANESEVPFGKPGPSV